MANFKIGDLVSFRYSGNNIHDPNPQVLVLHDNWQGLVHGLNFRYLSEQEINYIKAVLNPKFAEVVRKTDIRINAQLDRINNLVENLHINSPHDFYLRFVRGFIQPRRWDPYRRYSPAKIQGAKVITRREVLIGEQPDSLYNRFLNRLKFMRGPRM